MVSDPSALLMLKGGIPCHNSFDKYPPLNNSGLKLEHGAWGLHMLVLF